MVLDNLNWPKPEFDSVRVCDGCTNEIEHNEQTLVYFCDTIWLQSTKQRLPQVAPQGIYCLNCYPDGIPIPHKGTNEGWVHATMEHKSEAGVYSQDYKKIVKGSPKSAGFTWNPVKLLQQYHIAPVEAFKFHITPIYVFMLFRRSGLDLRGFINDNRFEIPDSKTDYIAELVRLGVRRSDNLSYHPEML